MSEDTSWAAEKGKATAHVDTPPAAPVTVDHLAKLIEAVNKREVNKGEVTPAPAGIEHTSGINRAIALADAVTKYQKLGRAIEPKLAEDGSNFPVWRAAVSNTVATVFESATYLDVDTADDQPDRAKLVGILVENSVHANLVPDVHGKAGRVSFALLRERFGSVSWTYIISHWLKIIGNGDATGQVNVVHAEMKTCLDEIKRQTGGITEDLLLAMALHSRCQANYQEIANALDSCLAVDKKSKFGAGV
ncbi:uncharacterized protein VP01_94g9 [Puccinia sorghi]|uniref:Uncharacterized protein n=1 Tax=Puccinia sorghi TaxID=27349 RepID=A0A0L6U703_9BASI|nr:uncharacterized protein VP01_94g9 [Puccinia sorghi]